MIGRVKKVGSDILFHAIGHANVHDVIALLHDNEVDVNCRNINGQTPLHVSKLLSLHQANNTNLWLFSWPSRSSCHLSISVIRFID